MTINAIKRGEKAKQAAQEILGQEPTDFASPLSVLASPAWRGVEADIWRARLDNNSIIIKHFHPDIAAYVHVNNAIAATEQAGLLSVGPEVIKSWREHNMFALEDLDQGWQAGGLHHAHDAQICADIIAQKKSFQQGAKLENTQSVFDDINHLYALAEKSGANLHLDHSVFYDFFQQAEAKIAACGVELKPCHRDGNTANLMVHERGDVMLIDFDCAANCDPFEDVGFYLAEMFDSEADARQGFEQWHGSFDEGLFQRARLYGLADDMRWGLIGALMAATSERRELEFGKYASWRFLRLQMHLKTSDANDRLRKVA